MEKYKVAIVIPCWNCGNVINNTIECIVNQTYIDWRLWCIDDQSTDNTQEVIREFADRDSRIHLVVREREPKGAQTCRNTGFDLAEGAEYVIWFDSDDQIAPYCLEQRVRFMDSHPELDFGVFKAKSFYNDIYETEGCELFGYRYAGCDDLRRLFLRTLPFVGWTNIYRRDSVLRFGLSWDENILSLQDSDFNIQSILKGMRYAYASDLPIDYFYYVNHSSGSVANKIFTERHELSHIYLLDKIYRSISEEQRKECRLELDEYIFYFINGFNDCRDFLSNMMSKDWMKGRSWYKARLRLYIHMRGKARYILFPFNSLKVRKFMKSYCKDNKKFLMEEMKLLKR